MLRSKWLPNIELMLQQFPDASRTTDITTALLFFDIPHYFVLFLQFYFFKEACLPRFSSSLIFQDLKVKFRLLVFSDKPELIVHSNPQRVRDCFPLAMTFMSEPKIASVRRIKTYMEDYYGFNNDAK